MQSKLEILRDRRRTLNDELRQGRETGLAILDKPAESRTQADADKLHKLTERGHQLRAEIDQVDGLIETEQVATQRRDVFDAAEAKVGYDRQARITRSDPEYRPDMPERSFFIDAFRASTGQDPMATQRLARSAQASIDEARSAGVNWRATTSGSYAGLVVPQYIVDEYALVLRSGRPVANQVRRQPLPEQGLTFQVPRGTTGASAASQNGENTNVSSTDEVWSNLTVNVATIAGQQDVSRQSLERGTPGIDTIIYGDLLKAYNAELDRQVVAGSGASGQMLGMQQTSGVVQASAYTAAATAVTFYTKTAGAVSAMASAGSAIQPDCWVMHPRRWYWLSSQVDGQNRPLVVPIGGGAFNTMGLNVYPGGYSGDNDADPPRYVGLLHGLPIIVDANVPTNVGTGPEDIVILLDSDQHILWEDNGGAPRQLRFEQTLGGQLTVKLVLYGYAAFTAGRYPNAVGIVGGNAGTAGFGQVSPAF